jgi:hypothetical protein
MLYISILSVVQSKLRTFFVGECLRFIVLICMFITSINAFLNSKFTIKCLTSG